MSRKTIHGLLCIAIIAAAMAASSAGGAAGRATIGDRLVASLVSFAQSHGMEPRAVLDSPQTLTRIDAAGRVTHVQLTAGQAIRRIASHAPWMDRPMEQGAAGPAELNAGDVGHLYARIGFGVTAAYRVTRSESVPETPGPVGAGVPGGPGFYEFGGPLTQIKGAVWDVGGHLIGSSPIGSNVDTAESGPYLPTDSGVVEDQSVDFLGHVGLLEQVVLCLPFVGCVAALGLFVGDGVTMFDAEDGTEFPILS